MESKMYSNLNNGGKSNNQANFSIASASIAKFNHKKPRDQERTQHYDFNLAFPNTLKDSITQK